MSANPVTDGEQPLPKQTHPQKSEPKQEDNKATANHNKEPFFKTLPGILTGIAAVLTALGGLLTGLSGAGIIGNSADDASIADTGLYVVSTIPENHATNIDPATDTIVIEFNAPIKSDSYSFVISDLGVTPELTGDPDFPEDNVCTIPVTLQPGITYALGINDAEHTNFLSAEDESISAEPFVLVFNTRK